MLSIVFGGASLFILSQILHDKGRTQLSKAVLPVGFGLTCLWLLWKMAGMFL